MKFFEASVVDTPTLAAPTFSFKNAITHGENGFLCNAGDWYSAIEYIYENSEKTQKIVDVAEKFCLRQYCGDYFFNQVENAYMAILKRR